MSNPKSLHSPAKHSSPNSSGTAPATGDSGTLLATRLSAAQLLNQFRKLLPVRLLAVWLARCCHKAFYRRAFTPQLTLWYCIFQRLDPNHALSNVVQNARAGGADRLSPRGKPLSAQLSSEATTSFSDARQRLPLEIFEKTLHHSAQRISDDVQAPSWLGLLVGLLDGSTLRLRPYGDIAQEFPPHRPGNAKKPPYWCVARVVALFALATGAVLDSAMGSLKASEQALSAMILQRSWAGWLLVSDRNFGVYSVVRATVAAQAQVLSRLTQARAAKLARSANQSLRPGLDLRLSWQPSQHDHCPEGLEAKPVEGRLLVVNLDRPGFRSITLYLFTTLLDAKVFSVQALAQLYGKRWQVELYLRSVKTQMDLNFLECHSAQMARKEWLAGLIAYNLVRWTMAAAAALAQVPLHILSFSQARERLLSWCIRWPARRPSVRSWKLLLARIAQARLSKRRKPRPSEPRAIRPFHKAAARLFGSRALARRKLAAAHAKS